MIFKPSLKVVLAPRRPPEDFLGRDRSSGGSALWRSVSADVALSEKSPYLGSAWVRWVFTPSLTHEKPVQDHSEIIVG